MSDRNHFESVLGTALGDLIPLIEEAVRVLDKPGTRALRRRIDGQFHFMVGAFDLVRRESLSDYDCSKLVLPRYERVTAVWPGRIAHEARKAREDKVVADVPTVPASELLPVRGLRVVVDNTKPASGRQTVAQIEGGAA